LTKTYHGRRLINHNDAHLGRDGVGRRLHEVAVEAQERRDIATKCDETTQDLINRVELVFEGRGYQSENFPERFQARVRTVRV
jgi:hypothetical protein